MEGLCNQWNTSLWALSNRKKGEGERKSIHDQSTLTTCLAFLVQMLFSNQKGEMCPFQMYRLFGHFHIALVWPPAKRCVAIYRLSSHQGEQQEGWPYGDGSEWATLTALELLQHQFPSDAIRTRQAGTATPLHLQTPPFTLITCVKGATSTKRTQVGTSSHHGNGRGCHALPALTWMMILHHVTSPSTKIKQVWKMKSDGCRLTVEACWDLLFNSVWRSFTRWKRVQIFQHFSFYCLFDVSGVSVNFSLGV